ncbi:MAG TPA: T9SS type A sorting domain-containing protein, partial [Bacteroidia bacterium]|nr:T9SS type A sorting domain-containing protein [Bacteroidia bacterium]
NTATVTNLAVSPANNQVIWACKPGGLYKSADGGATWTTITSMPSGNITYIACSNTDPNKAWITYSGFTNSSKVFQTNDQGVTWVNLSASIPNIPVNCITYVNNSNDALYIGTDVGVFFKDATMSVWQPFFNGLPNVIVSQLAIFYPTGKIRASTYGRGLWESDLYVPGTYAPTAAFGSNQNISCQGAAMHFSDYSAGQPTSWNWSFPGGSPSTSNLQNPIVFYNTPGVYSVSLVTSNANGTDSVTYSNYINIASSPQNNPATVGDQRCGPGVVNLSATGSGSGTLRWWDAQGGGNVVATGSNYSPTITGTTTYYVDEDFPPGAIDYVGEFGNGFGAGAFFTANDIRGLYFDVTNPVILNSVDVFANTSGDRTIEILDAQGNTYADTTVFVPASGANTTTVTLNFKLYPGSNYFIKCRGYVDLYRNSGGAVYPYNSTSINLTGSNAGSPGYYYFFYNWQYTDITCNTGRTPVIALDTCSVSIEEQELQSSMEVFPNPTHGQFHLTFNAKKASNYSVNITNALGAVVYRSAVDVVAGKVDKQIDLSELSKGVYMINVSDGNAVVSKRITLN